MGVIAAGAPPRAALPRVSPGTARLLVIAALLALWEIAARVFGDPSFVSPPSKVVAALAVIFADPKIVHAIVIAVVEIVTAFVIAVTAGSAIGLAVGLHGFTKAAIMPVILLLYAIPQATFLPMFVLSFGIGMESKIAFGVSHGVFPVIVTVVGGVQNLRPQLLTAARSMGASRLQTFGAVVFPHLIPSLFTGMRLAMTASLLGVLLAELYVSTAGIGYYTRHFSQSFQPAQLFALIAVLAAIAASLNELCRMAERRFSRWHAA